MSNLNESFFDLIQELSLAMKEVREEQHHHIETIATTIVRRCQCQDELCNTILFISKPIY